MTHQEIYDKFMIEYDKATITSSYPSLTKYEVATILDKAYLALIGQKVTGNNIRRAPFEADTKSVSDLQGLIVNEDLTEENGHMSDENEVVIPNMSTVNLPTNFLYFVSLYVYDDPRKYEKDKETTGYPESNKNIGIYSPIKLVTHDIALKFMVNRHNIPWIKNPVCFIEDNKINILFDYYNRPLPTDGVFIKYIKIPETFVNKIDGTNFELNNQMAEELISLAVSFALENVESQRLNTKLNMRGLEA